MDCTCSFQSVVIGERIVLSERGAARMLEQEANSRTANVEILNKGILKKLFDLKRGEFLVVETMIKIKTGEELFDTYGSCLIY